MKRAAWTGLLLLSACTVGPDYATPSVPDTSHFKEAGNWKKGEPQDQIARGDWYKIFHDAKLNELETKAQMQNQNLRAAVARGAVRPSGQWALRRATRRGVMSACSLVES